MEYIESADTDRAPEDRYSARIRVVLEMPASLKQMRITREARDSRAVLCRCDLEPGRVCVEVHPKPRRRTFRGAVPRCLRPTLRKRERLLPCRTWFEIGDRFVRVDGATRRSCRFRR